MEREKPKQMISRIFFPESQNEGKHEEDTDEKVISYYKSMP